MSVKNMCILNKLYCYISSRGRLCDPVFRFILPDTAVEGVSQKFDSFAMYTLIHLVVCVPVNLHDPTLRRLGKTLILKNAVDIFSELC